MSNLLIMQYALSAIHVSAVFCWLHVRSRVWLVHFGVVKLCLRSCHCELLNVIGKQQVCFRPCVGLICCIDQSLVFFHFNMCNLHAVTTSSISDVIALCLVLLVLMLVMSRL